MGDATNVLLIVLEGVRADHLSCYGYQRQTTPFLDELSRDGVRFANMTATAPTSLASHAALFTGLHSVTHGATSEHPSLIADHAVLAESLKAAGYRTAAFCTNPSVSPENGFGRGFDAFFTQRFQSRLTTRAVNFGRRAADRLLRRGDAGARRSNAAFSHWLGSDERPFFAFLHYDEARFPVQPPPQFLRRFLPKQTDVEQASELNRSSAKWMFPPSSLDDSVKSVLRDLYDGALSYIDHCVSEVASTLRATGTWERTLLVVTGDHGEQLGEHGIVGHAVGLADGLLRVPLLLRCPATVPQGFVVDELAQTSDIAPTICTLLGLSVSSFVRGRTLLSSGRATPGPAFTVAERFRSQPGASADAGRANVRMKTIRTRRYKFIWRSDEQNELYDIVSDPAEHVNLIESETQRADELRRQLFDWLADADAFEAPEDDAGAAPIRATS